MADDTKSVEFTLSIVTKEYRFYVLEHPLLFHDSADDKKYYVMLGANVFKKTDTLEEALEYRAKEKNLCLPIIRGPFVDPKYKKCHDEKCSIFLPSLMNTEIHIELASRQKITEFLEKKK